MNDPHSSPPAPAETGRTPLLSARLFWLVWGGIGLLLALQWLPFRRQLAVPAALIVLFAFTYNFLWAALSLPTALLVRRLRRGQTPPWRYVAVLAPVGVAFTLLHITIYFGFYRLVRAVTPWDYYKTTLGRFLRGSFQFDFMFFLLIVLAVLMLEFLQLAQHRREHAEALQRELIRTRLDSLKQQLQPHFLFNTLNSIQALMDEDIPTAKKTVTRLAAFLRFTLELGDEMEIPLRRELDFVKNYLEIEQVRFHDRLTVQIEAAAETLDKSVPALILQPLVENAVRHGIAPFARQGWVRIEAALCDGRLRLRVSDSGPGVNGAPSPGVGLANVRRRLQLHFGTQHELHLGRDQTGGFRAEMSWPDRPEVRP